jgi:hypothetical protein
MGTSLLFAVAPAQCRTGHNKPPMPSGRHPRLGFSKLGQSPPAAHGTPADAKFQGYPEPGKPATERHGDGAGRACHCGQAAPAGTQCQPERPHGVRSESGPRGPRPRPTSKAPRAGRPPSDTERPPADRTTAGPSPTPNLKFKLAGPPGAGLALSGRAARGPPESPRPADPGSRRGL